jgi:hypothetical protein
MLNFFNGLLVLEGDGSFIISKTYCSFIINQEIAYITYGLVFDLVK